jgi:gamma-glutamylcyclotransferase (GGCT)/AIG2-like uncharacterized protein YtfP
VTEFLAVYGTLMAGVEHDGKPAVEHALRAVGACRIPGVLHSAGDYPCLVEAAGEVSGELYEVVDPSVLDELDRYEGAEYERRRVRLIEPEVDAWVYVWTGAPPGEPIDDGDWRAFLAIRGDR